MSAFYNEIDPVAAAWLRELIKAGVIAPGVVDERSIEDIQPDELMGYTQCHFFAGIGVWSYALRCAGWPDDRPVWTGSCPCQPFSAAGKRGGVTDERHLWPAFYHLISQCRPVTVFGEQVASKDGLSWLDAVQSDLEAAGYTVGAADIPACGLGAPHIRNRLWFVADTTSIRHNGHSDNRREINRKENEGRVCESQGNSSSHFLAHPPINGRDERWAEREGQFGASTPVNGGESGNMADTGSAGSEGSEQRGALREVRESPHDTTRECRATNGFWADAEWLPCRDGKARPVEPGTFPLVNGTPANLVRVCDPGEEVDVNNSPEARVMRLKGYGNAIVAAVAAAWITAYMEETV